MIIGIGVDIVEIGRMARWKEMPGLFERFFSPDELRDARSRGNMEVASLAARFAAKEALGKALGTGMRGLGLRQIAVQNDVLGKPSMRLEGSALDAFKRAGGETLFVSLSHERDNAIAMVVIEGT